MKIQYHFKPLKNKSGWCCICSISGANASSLLKVKYYNFYSTEYNKKCTSRKYKTIDRFLMIFLNNFQAHNFF